MSKCALVFTNLDLYDPPQERIITKEKENKKIIKKIKPNKLLLAALSVAFSIFGAIPSLAADTPPVPTLDKLHNAGTTIPDTAPPQIYPESAYTYTPADSPGTNTVTRYEWSDTENKLVPKYYTVTLKQTEYGYKNAGGETKTFTVQTPSSDGTTDAFSYTINYYTDPARLAPDRITTNQNGANINNDFVEKSTTSKGGAIYNDRGTIGDITGDFIGNYAQSNSSSSASGGAIRNYYGGTIGNITANFISNYVYSEKSTAEGGAINNLTTYGLFPVIIGNITGDFIGNYAQSDSSDANGGAIYNYWGEFGNITGDFIGNYAFSTEASPKGGAIYNEGTISNITGDFIGNYAKSNSSSAYGGAIYNYNRATIDNITGDFIGNYVSGSSYANGGAIYNSHATIGDITGDYINNYAYSSSEVAMGGAIYSYDSEIGNISGDFVGNYVSSTGASYDNVAAGGAIFNSGEIGNITGDFIGNFISDKYARGGAIYNYQEFYSASESVIGNITGNFIGNYTKGSSSQGGAIYNYSKDSIAEIGNINADFIGNHSSCGGAIYNYGSYADTVTIGDITGDFIGNYAQSTESYAYGGAIYNHTDNSITTIGNITGDFIGNYSSGFTSASGGAIYNYSYNSIATIGDITGDFIGNYAQSSSSARGGAIYNNGSNATIGDITGDFIGNYAQSGSSYALGGAIYNYIYSSTNVAQIGLTNNNFLNNHASGTTAKGGAIFTNYDLTLNTDNANTLISGNYTESNGVKDQNAIYVANLANSSGIIQRETTLTLNAINNGKIQIDDKISGGSYYQSSNKLWETSDHAYNLSLTGDGTGTVSLYNDVTNANVSSDNVTVDLANNDTHDYNFVSMTAGENTKLNLDINLIDKTSDTITTQNESTGTLIVSTINTIGSTTEDAITVQVIKNTNQSSNLQLELGSNIQEVDDTLANLSNTLYNDELFTQQGGITLTTTNTINDSIKILKDKIYDTLDIITTKESNEERNFNFRTTDNYIASKDLDTTSKGTLNINGIGTTTPSTIDANKHTMFDLQNETTLNISNTSINNAKNFAINAENINSKVNLTNASFKNTDGTAIKSNVDINITADAGKTEFSGNTQAVQMNNADKTITMNAINQGEIILNDTIDGTKGYKLALTGDDKSKITISNNINNANVSLDNTNLYLSKENVFDNSQSLTLNSGTMYLNNDTIGTMHVPTLNLTGTTNLSVDVDLENESMDRITADTYNISDDAIINVNNLNLISTTEKDSVKILFADEYLANNVEYTGESPTSYKGTNTIYSPIYKYDVNYSVDENDHQGFFTFVRGSTGTIDDFNPAVTAPSVATQAGAYTTQLQTFNYAFQHADTFMNIPYLERVAMKNNNRYALSPTGDATDVGTFSPLLTKEESSGFWVKPYASFENIPLNNGPKVSNINYGTLIGYDTNLTPISKGWERVLTGYVGYNGASQRYSGVDAYQNGGILGSTATFYKGNFFNATTLSVGATAGDATTMYGTENYTMLLAGIGNKTGYNFEFKEGKIILQPSLLISYTFVNTFDYTNGAGVRIKSDPLNAIQLAPGIKLIGNTENGWQPYLSVAMVWNLLDDSKVTANDVRLPEMSIDPYVQYGVGVQKRFNDKFMAFGQAMIHNGGRNGLSLSAGFRWKVGKEK